MQITTPCFDAELEIEWAVKLGLLSADAGECEAYLQVGSVFRLPLVHDRCQAKAKAAGQDITFGVTYEREVLEVLTPQEIEGLRRYVKSHPGA
jgi:hypothetical protein